MAHRTSPPLASLVAAYYGPLTAYVVRKVGNPALAADIVQETWLRATVALCDQTIGNARAWLYRTAHNLAIDRIRHERMRSQLLACEADGAAIAATEPSPEAALLARERLSQLAAAIEALPPRCREVFVMRRHEGFSAAEIADALGISVNMVAKHIRVAMDHIRRHLDDAGH